MSQHRSPPTPHFKVPPRVTCGIPIHVAISSIPGAGRGLIAGGDVATGDLIFSVKQPRLSIIEQTESALKSTCDNCFAAKVQEQATVPMNGELRFSACLGCNVYRYCSKECQRAAWNRHHKVECKILKQVKESNLSYGARYDNRQPFYLHNEFRGMLRLLMLHKKNMIPLDEWAEYVKLQSRSDVKMQQDWFEESTTTLAGLLKECTETPLEMDEIIDLICALTNNNLTIYNPLLFDQSFTNVFDGTSLVGCGPCLEPFAALLNHSCDPNALWIFEGTELRIRARKAISAGQEITLSYIAPCDYGERQRILNKNWNIKCNCSLCQRGHLGLPLKLHEVIERLCDSEIKEAPQGLEEDQQAAQLVRSEGGNGNLLLRRLYMRIYRSAILHSDEELALKTALTLYYNIEPAQYPPMSADERITTLYNIISLLTQPFAIDIFPHFACYFSVYVALRRTLAAGSKRCWGEDSHVAEQNASGLEAVLEGFKDSTGFSYEDFEAGRVGGVQGVEDGSTGRDLFIQGMQLLLAWAEVEIEGVKVLFREL